MIRNLGHALSVVYRQQRCEAEMHDDVDAFYAPSECHELVAKGEDKRQRLARKHAEAIARRPFRVIMREAKRRVTGKSLHEAEQRLSASQYGG